MPTCRFCKERRAKMVKYEVRHYAHYDCYLAAGKKLADLNAWQVAQFPYRLLKEHCLINEAERIADEAVRHP